MRQLAAFRTATIGSFAKGKKSFVSVRCFPLVVTRVCILHRASDQTKWYRSGRRLAACQGWQPRAGVRPLETPSRDGMLFLSACRGDLSAASCRVVSLFHIFRALLDIDEH